MTAGAFSIDFETLIKRFEVLGAKTKKACKKGLWAGAAALKKFGDEIEPKAPHLWGNLRGTATRNQKAKKEGKVVKEWAPKITEENRGDQVFSMVVSYCAPYAARWHEAVDEVINWSESGVGPKWLEAKIARDDLRKKCYQIVADTIKDELGAE